MAWHATGTPADLTVKNFLTVGQILRLLCIDGRRILLSIRSVNGVCTHEQRRFDCAGRAGVFGRHSIGHFLTRLAVGDGGVMQQVPRDEEILNQPVSIPGRLIRLKFIDLRDAQ
jgi:hypothetical protein